MNSDAKRIVERCGLPDYIAAILEANGFISLQDLTEVDDAMLTEIEQCIREPQFAERYDLSSENQQIKFFGMALTNERFISDFQFKTLERKKMLRLAAQASVELKTFNEMKQEPMHEPQFYVEEETHEETEDPVIIDMTQKIISNINQMLEAIAANERITSRDVILSLNAKTTTFACQIICPICSKSCAISFVRGKCLNTHNYKRHLKTVHLQKEFKADEIMDIAMDNVKDAESCFVCNEFLGPFKNELTVVTGYSEKSIHSILESFLGQQISSAILEDAGICQNCFIKFNDYDEHQTLAIKIQTEILSLYNRVSSEEVAKIGVKTEQDDLTAYEECFLSSEEAMATKSTGTTPKTVRVVIKSEKTIQMTTSKSSLSQRKAPRKSSKPKPSIDKDAGLTVVMIDDKKHYQCDVCHLISFTTRYELKKHRQTHSTERNFICQACGSSFKTRECLYQHEKRHGKDFFQCDLCPKRYILKPHLKEHLDAIHLMRRDYVCQVCGKGFSRRQVLRQHLKQTHINDRKLICSICGFAVLNQPKMNRHMLSHTGERKHACNICGQRFIYSYNVTNHIKHVHNRAKRPVYEEEKLLCPICGMKFKRIYKVKEHIEEVHASPPSENE